MESLVVVAGGGLGGEVDGVGSGVGVEGLGAMTGVFSLCCDGGDTEGETCSLCCVEAMGVVEGVDDGWLTFGGLVAMGIEVAGGGVGGIVDGGDGGETVGLEVAGDGTINGCGGACWN